MSDSKEAVKISKYPLSDDIKLVANSLAFLAKRHAYMQTENIELKKSKEQLEKDLKKAQDNEFFERNSVLHLSKDFNKLQVSFTGMVDIRGENMKLMALVKTYEKQIAELIKELADERKISKSVMQKTCTDIAEQGRKDLQAASSENDILREQLDKAHEQLRNMSSEFQTKIRSIENSKRNENRQSTAEHQEKFSKIQSELQATKAHCRELQEKLRIDTSEFQKKIKELERGNGNPFSRAPQSAADRVATGAPKKKPLGSRPLPSLDFVNSIASKASGNQQTSTIALTAMPTFPKKRKLFVQRLDMEDD